MRCYIVIVRGGDLIVWCRVHGMEIECNSELCKDCINENKCVDEELYCPDYEY